MDSIKNNAEVTREQLYERVWATPVIKLAAELGISDVALAKRCKKLNVPRPPRGYWAQISAGLKPKRKPLPPGPKSVKFAALDQAVVQPALLSIPASNKRLHPTASLLLTNLQAAKADSEGLVRVESQMVPLTQISPKMFMNAVKAFHVVLGALEPYGIKFEKARSKYDTASFVRGHERLFLSIEEPVVTVRHEPTEADKRRPSWEWVTSSRQLANKLKFSFHTERYGSRSCGSWMENNMSLEATLVDVVKGALKHFADREQSQLEEKERHRKEMADYELRMKAQQIAQHKASLKKIAETRADDLLKAAEWNRVHRNTLEFINDCENKWRNAQSGQLLPEQSAWLHWAIETAAALCPFGSGYPDPAVDGSFDETKFPLGSPLPETRKFPLPPSLAASSPDSNSPSQNTQSYQPYQAPSPYPFWLKHPRR